MPVRMTGPRVKRWRRQGIFLRNAVDLSSRSQVEESGARFLVAKTSALPPAFLRTLRKRYGMPIETNGLEELYSLSGSADDPPGAAFAERAAEALFSNESRSRGAFDDRTELRVPFR